MASFAGEVQRSVGLNAHGEVGAGVGDECPNDVSVAEVAGLAGRSVSLATLGGAFGVGAAERGQR